MSKHGRRAGTAFVSTLEEAPAVSAPPPEDRTTAGNWSRQAMRQMDANLEEARAEAERANELVYQGIMDGTIAIRIPISAIEDLVGTDRIAPTDTDGGEESYASLVENIRQRGLRQPIRVRCTDHNWRPDRVFPRDVTGLRFVLQSGRRRLKALAELGRDPLCFLSFVDEQSARRQDLEERFFENVVRKNLTSFERLYSIGLIAKETPGATQSQIGEIIGVSISSVSRGLAVVEFRDQLAGELDLSKASIESIDAALKKIRGRHESGNPEAVRSRERRKDGGVSGPLPFRKRNLPIGAVRLRSSSTGGRVLTIDGADLSDERINAIMSLLEKL